MEIFSNLKEYYIVTFMVSILLISLFITILRKMQNYDADNKYKGEPKLCPDGFDVDDNNCCVTENQILQPSYNCVMNHLSPELQNNSQNCIIDSNHKIISMPMIKDRNVRQKIRDNCQVSWDGN